MPFAGMTNLHSPSGRGISTILEKDINLRSDQRPKTSFNIGNSFSFLSIAA